jgi:hypothetical protein
VKRLQDWPNSNYLEWIGRRNGTLFDKVFVMENFPAAPEYTAFVTDYINTRRLADGLEDYLQAFE